MQTFLCPAYSPALKVDRKIDILSDFLCESKRKNSMIRLCQVGLCQEIFILCLYSRYLTSHRSIATVFLFLLLNRNFWTDEQSLRIKLVSPKNPSSFANQLTIGILWRPCQKNPTSLPANLLVINYRNSIKTIVLPCQGYILIASLKHSFGQISSNSLSM